MARTPFIVPDGQVMKIYSADNTYLGEIYVDAAGQLVLASASSGDVVIGEVGTDRKSVV